MPKNKDPFKINQVICYVNFEDEEGNPKMMKVDTLTIDHAIERLGGIERALEAKKQNFNVNKP